MATRKQKTQPVAFQEQLVLFRYFLNQFGREALGDFAKKLNTPDAEGYDDNQNTLFYVYLRDFCRKLKISKDQLRVYDENICRHIKRIGTLRGGITLKYFQYLSLLFTEIYLDKYFTDKAGFAAELNAFLSDITAQSMFRLDIAPYTEKTLNKLAFMCATGSGKTLIMHINILQFLHYLKRAQRQNSHIAINKIIVLAPNEMMALQHLDELKLSSIAADLFRKDDVLSVRNADVIVIDMNKLKEEGKVKTVSVDQFEQNNLVLVDEGHRGMSGNVWYDYRTRLSADGFAFEYSATFKQALKSGNAGAGRQLMDEYGKSIIMDYSYKYFYSDGYGKDYRIYNLKEGIDEETRHIYLIGCLVSYYQQLKVFLSGRNEFQPYLIEKPLLVFVGNRVTASTSTAELTDIEEVLGFLDKFLRNRSKTIDRINALFHDDTGLVDGYGNELFLQAFRPLKELFGTSHLDAAAVYADMLRLLFNTETVSDEPRLHVEDLRQVSGEIALKVGNDGKYFGVISIGDTKALTRLCEKNGIVTRSEEFITESFFRNINRKDSTINVLIGSRKFTEGWNSWRVSTMGLINFAKGEGSQAIQLFGRGVRLRGYEGCLKRSRYVDIPAHPKFISSLETLTIFGIKAKYMEEFKEYLETEDVPANDNIHEFRLPVVNRFDQLNGRKLHVLRLPPDRNFKKQAARLCLDVPDNGLTAYLAQNRIVIDCRAKVQTIDSTFSLSMISQAEEHSIPAEYLEFLDYDRIFEELEEFKNEKYFFNISIDRKRLKSILQTEGLYALIIPANHLQIDSIEKLHAAADYCIMVLKSYMEKFFKYHKDKWESPFLSYQELTPNDPNFVQEYTLSYTSLSSEDKTADELEVFLDELEKLLLDSKGIPGYKRDFNNRLTAFDFRHHLYAPLICMKGNGLQIQISPVSLNEDEKLFVDLLKEYTEKHTEELDGKAFYLLRNKSKAGIGFFEAGNFYPDYILWIDTPEKQYISFIDPKGLLNVAWDDPKIRFYQTIKERQNITVPPDGKCIILNSFIMSGTAPGELRNRWLGTDKEDWTARNVMCLAHPDCVETMFKKIFSE